MVVVVVIKSRSPAKKAAVSRVPMTTSEIIAAVREFKEQARRLRPPLNQRPAAFHEDKSDLVRAAIDLEEALVHGRKLADRPGP